MDYISGTYDGESVRIAKVTGSEKEVATFYVNSLNQLCVGINPMSWERSMLVSTGDYTPSSGGPTPITPTGYKRILGRSTSYQNDLFGGAGNTSAWWFYGDQSVVGPKNISYTHRIQNQTGKNITKIAIPFIGTLTNHAPILAVWVGRGGSLNDTTATTYQRMTFAGDTSAVCSNATPTAPSYKVTDSLTLTTPWAPNEWILVRVVFEKYGTIPTYDSFSNALNTLSNLTRSWISVTDSGSTSATLSAGTWNVGWEIPYCHIFCEFPETESPELSILAYGDSVINQWKIWDDANALYRDGWQWRLELSADTDAKKYHVATAGNGGYELSQFTSKFNSLWPMYKDWTDVVMYEGWTPNGAPITSERRASDEVLIQNVKNLITSAGKGWLMIYPSPLGAQLDVGNSDQIKLYHDETIAWGKSTYPGHVIDGRGGVWDPANHDRFLTPTYSKDDTHQTDAGAIAFAAYIKPILETTLTNLGYEV